MGRRNRNDPEERGLPDGMALQAIAVTHTYDETKHGRDWRSQLIHRQLAGNEPVSWNHWVIASTCELLLGESDGSFLAEGLGRQLGHVVPFLGRELGTGEYPSYVMACTSLAARKIPDTARGHLRASLVLAALGAAPGPLDLAKGDALSPDITVPCWGERVQGRVSSPVTPILARSIGLRVDEAQCRQQVWLWPYRCAVAGTLADAFTLEEQALLRGLVQRGDLAPILEHPLSYALHAIRPRNAVRFWRWERGGAVAVDRTDNPNSTGTQAACWGPDKLRYLVHDGDIRGKIPAKVCSAQLSTDGAKWLASAKPEGGPFESWKHLSIDDTAPLGRLLWTASIEPGALGLQVAYGDKPTPAGVEVGPMPPQTDPKGPW